MLGCVGRVPGENDAPRPDPDYYPNPEPDITPADPNRTLPLVVSSCKENTTEEGFPPLVASLVAADNHRPQKQALCLFLRVVAAVSTTLENERLSSFLRAVIGGIPV